MADPKQTAHTPLGIEDFDVWQDEHHHITADKASYQMVRSIAVDFANSALSNRLRSHDRLVEALEGTIGTMKRLCMRYHYCEKHLNQFDNCGFAECENLREKLMLIEVALRAAKEE